MSRSDDCHPTSTPDRADSFSVSVLLLIFAMLSQRVIGLVRNVILCGMLSESELGRWSLAMTYLTWAAPFFILGLPGSFGRLSEHFRSKGQLRSFLRRTTTASMVLVCFALAIHSFIPKWFAKIVFNNLEQVTLIPLLGLVLAVVIVFNAMTELLTSLRSNRAVSQMQLIQSLGFAVLSVAVLIFTNLREGGVLLAFGIATAAAAVLGLWHVGRQWREVPVAAAPEPSAVMWKRVRTWAFWIWCGNLVVNLFDYSDQFLVKHYSNLAPNVVDAMLGQLYASRVLPVMVVSIASLIAGCILPYLINDHEAGRSDLAMDRLNSVVKFSALGFTAIAAVTHIMNPILFSWLLRGKYDHGLELMPWAFVQFSWFGLILISSKYLIYVDRPRIGILALLMGLISAVALNLLLLPRLGLQGVAIAMTLANGIALLSLLWVTAKCGMRWSPSTLFASAIPVTMCLGGGPSLGILAALAVGGWQSQWLITQTEREQFHAGALRGITRVRQWFVGTSAAAT